ncbi:MAG: CotH kinase family protein [Candidatus Stahlbacteria bacterium]|nr:CotH kinase family protein [Candidatus Stahlbacteria bacterium]
MQKLKQITLILLIIFPINALGQDFYDINKINTIELFFSQPNWDEILDSLYAVGDEERLVGTAVINGVQFDSVGVRYKGSSSYNPNRIKNPLSIKLDYLLEGQKIDDYGTLKLANVYKDPSFVREVLSYEIARKYMCAGRANFINVYINGDLIGLYTSDQCVDKFFLGNHFYSNGNAFFEGELTDDTPSNPVVVWGYLGPDSVSYYDYYALRSDSGWSDLIEFLDIFNNTPTSVEQVLDVDRHLWLLAFDILMVNLDAPINFGHNFYLYKDGSGQFNPIIWDLNENFGGFTMLIGVGPLNVTQMQQLSPFLNISNSNYPIINKILSDSTYKKRYLAHMKTMIAENFSNNWYRDRALEIQSIIDADVQADPNKFYTYSDFLNNIYNSAGFGPQSIVGLTQLMDARIAYLINHSAFQGAAPVISNVSYLPTNVPPSSNVCFSAKVEDANLVMLGYKQSIAEKFEKLQMFDDGNHSDGAAGDGVYGVSILVGASDGNYYIYAENDTAGMFSPERAEYEFYMLPVTADLVINEFLAINTTTVPDQNGEYDDWIELYNNSSSPISLNGYYLTDNEKDLTKWSFPNISIPANGYLIIWADNDTMETGLHANFKLSGYGEEIILSNPSQIIVNGVVFGQQTADISTGRYPNGTGLFIQMPPTFAAENDSGFGIEDGPSHLPKQFALEQNFPNPFAHSTTIKYHLPVKTEVSLKIYDITGRTVKTLVNGEKNAGSYSVNFDANYLTTGIYFVKLVAGKYKATRKLILAREGREFR